MNILSRKAGHFVKVTIEKVDIHMCSRVHERTPQAVDVRSRTPENIQSSKAGYFVKVTIKKVDHHVCPSYF